MKKNIILFILVLFGIFLSTNHTFAYVENTVRGYDIHMKVNKNRTIEVKESFTVNFVYEQSNFSRSIPLVDEIVRGDGSTVKVYPKVSHIYAKERIADSKDLVWKKITFSGDKTPYRGLHTFELSYTYDFGNDTNENEDELYFHLIDKRWRTVLSNVTFSITMPEEFDASNIEFLVGKEKDFRNDKVTYQIQGNTISGKVNQMVEFEEEVTVGMKLPEWYFIEKKEKVNLREYLLKILSICLICSFVILWGLYGKDKSVNQRREYYPPDGLTPTEVSYFDKGKVDSQSVAALLLHLAQKGFLSIEKIWGKMDFKIAKLKEYDGKNVIEREWMRGMSKDSFYVSESNKFFYYVLESIQKYLQEKKQKFRIFEKQSLKIQQIILGLTGIFSFIVLMKPIEEYLEIESLRELVLIEVFFLVIIGLSLYFSIKLLTTKGPWILRILTAIAAFLPTFLVSSFVLIPAIRISKEFTSNYFFYVVSILIMIFFIIIMPQRTEESADFKEQIEGLKQFMIHAEEEELRKIVNRNPDYFYEMLPYAYALDISRIWMSKFKRMKASAPSWYISGLSGFQYDDFCQDIHYLMEKFLYNMFDETIERK